LNQFVPEGDGADGNFDGVINAPDYSIWRTRFGQHSDAGSGTAFATSADAAGVPEPAAWGLLSCGAACLLFCRRRRKSDQRCGPCRGH
jgi:hypothetical protein